jgi:hypothetical protein
VRGIDDPGYCMRYPLVSAALRSPETACRVGALVGLLT